MPYKNIVKYIHMFNHTYNLTNYQSYKIDFFKPNNMPYKTAELDFSFWFDEGVAQLEFSRTFYSR